MALTCGVGHRHRSDLALLWLWPWPAPAAPSQSLAWELPRAMGRALRRQKQTKKPPLTKALLNSFYMVGHFPGGLKYLTFVRLNFIRNSDRRVNFEETEVII